MALSTFQGPIRSLGGFYNQGLSSQVVVAAATTLTVPDHAGKLIRLTATSGTITLPTLATVVDPVSSGPGPDPNTNSLAGVVFDIYIEAATTTCVFARGGTNTFVGSVIIAGGTTTAAGFVTSAGVSLTLNATTQGGIQGGRLRFTALPTNKWAVDGTLVGSGVTATPFA